MISGRTPRSSKAAAAEDIEKKAFLFFGTKMEFLKKKNYVMRGSSIAKKKLTFS